jgi:hypothetical protein
MFSSCPSGAILREVISHAVHDGQGDAITSLTITSASTSACALKSG